MAAERFVRVVEATFRYFGSLGKWHLDPAGVDAVREIRDLMVRDLSSLPGEPNASELAALCRKWREHRIEPDGAATLPPDLFIESVCEAIELA